MTMEALDTLAKGQKRVLVTHNRHMPLIVVVGWEQDSLAVSVDALNAVHFVPWEQARQDCLPHLVRPLNICRETGINKNRKGMFDTQLRNCVKVAMSLV